jgi:hypothetical protein
MGSFLIFGFAGLFWFDFLSASASAKVIDWTTNFASLIYFSATSSTALALRRPSATSSARSSAHVWHFERR